MVAVTMAAPEIVGIFGQPVAKAVITQGRERGPSTKVTSWGLRPKLRVVFTLPQKEAEKPEAIWFKGTVRLLKDGDEYSYQELKYAQLPEDSTHWQEQYQREQSKWHSPKLETWEEFAALRMFRPCAAPSSTTIEESPSKKTKTEEQQCHYEFDYYPCSFWLETGSTHSKMELQLQIATSVKTGTIYHPDHYGDDDSKWSSAIPWNTRIEYRDDCEEILQRIKQMKEKDNLTLDGHTRDLEDRLKKT